MPTSIEDTRIRELVDAHSGSLLRYLARSGVPQADLDDALQEVFVVTAAKLSQVPIGNERAFLFGSAFRVAGNARRGRSRRLRAQDQMMVAAWDPSPTMEDLTDRLRARAMLDEVIEHLPEEGRLVFRLFELEGEPIEAIAQRLGVPMGTVASRLRRARAAMHQWTTRLSANRSIDNTIAHVNGNRVQPEVLSWWVSGGEADALSALVDIYHWSHPNQHVLRATAEGADQAKRNVRARMQRGVPPDTFLMNGGADLFGWVRRASRDAMDPIDFLFKSEGWARAIPEDVLDLVTYSGRAYAVPVNVHRTNALFYNKRIFRELGITAPTTLDELHATIDIIAGHDISPLACGWRDPWTLSLLTFENVMLAVAGGDYYRAFFRGQRSPRDAEFRDVLVEVGRLLRASNSCAPDIGWQEAADLVGSGQAAMMVMGDWAKGYLANAGWKIDEDFGQVAMPGTEGSFVFATDTFGLPRNTSSPGSAIDLLKIFGSEAGQNAFNLIKGSIPARRDVDLSQYDVLARATARDFAAAIRYPCVASIAPAPFMRVVDVVLARFAQDGDVDECVASLREHYNWLT